MTKVLLDSTKRKATGVVYTDVSTGEEYEQPAAIVALCAYAINNVHLMLLSGIGTPYDPATQKGIVGRNYCYQPGGGGVTLFFEDKIFNPFMAAAPSGRCWTTSTRTSSSIAPSSVPSEARRSRLGRATAGRSGTAPFPRERRAGVPSGRRRRRSGTCGR